MSQNQDTVPSSYKYSWDSENEIAIEDFAAKYKPSMVQNDGSKPWIWVRTRRDTEGEHSDFETAQSDTISYIEGLTKEVEDIKNNPDIPVRSSKKTGAKSKKEVREERLAVAVEDLKSISIKCKWTTGKWLIFAGSEHIDKIWASIAVSLVTGPLSATVAHTAKVSTSPLDDVPNYRHVLCIYMPDVYDKDAVVEVMRVLLRHHGASLTGVKSDLYTTVGIDSKHPSQLPSTIWSPKTLMSEADMKKIKDEFYKELEDKKTSGVDIESSKAAVDSGKAEGSKAMAKTSSKRAPKKKAVNNDPFGESDEELPVKAPAKKALVSKQATKRPKDLSSSDEDEDERPKKKVGARN